MRLTVLLLALIAVPALAVAGEPAPEAAPAAPSRPATATAVIAVKGMSCSCCTGRVTRALEAVGGVEKAEVTLEPAQARVAFDPTKVTVAALVKAVVEEGFEASRLDAPGR